jgi:hypothetical protein
VTMPPVQLAGLSIAPGAAGGNQAQDRHHVNLSTLARAAGPFSPTANGGSLADRTVQRQAGEPHRLKLTRVRPQASAARSTSSSGAPDSDDHRHSRGWTGCAPLPNGSPQGDKWHGHPRANRHRLAH